MTGLVLALFGVSFALAALLTPVVRRLGTRRGLLDSAGSDGHAKTLRSVPNIGGIAITWSIVLPLIAGLAGAWLIGDRLAEDLPALAAHLPGMRSQTGLAVALVGGLLWLHVLGLLDDRRAMGAWLKLGLMLVPPLVLILGFDVRMLTALDGWLGPVGVAASMVVTLLWFVVITNAVNFMDNMDGLAAGTTAVAGAFFATAAILNGQWFVAMTLALLVGAAAGFWIYNKPKASIFMGDGGSLVLGHLLAFLTVRTTYTGDGAMPENAWYAVFMPLCVLAVPLYDFTSVVIIRLLQGKSPMVGDQQHFSHRLRDRGLTDAQVMTVVCGCSAVTGIGGILLGSVTEWQAILIGVQVVLVVLLLALYEHGSRSGHDEDAEGSS